MWNVGLRGSCSGSSGRRSVLGRTGSHRRFPGCEWEYLRLEQGFLVVRKTVVDQDFHLCLPDSGGNTYGPPQDRSSRGLSGRWSLVGSEFPPPLSDSRVSGGRRPGLVVK